MAVEVTPWLLAKMLTIFVYDEPDVNISRVCQFYLNSLMSGLKCVATLSDMHGFILSPSLL